MNDITALKLGGSVVTDKSGDCAIDHTRLAEIAERIAARRAGAVILIHGAGSCGHPEARQYRIQDGVDAGNLPGIYHTHTAVSGLNTAVVEALRSAGCEAVGIHPLHLALAENGRLVAMETGHLREMLARDMVPVLHGDVVMDRARGACIVSGDQLITYLAAHLPAGRVGLATDVQGVLRDGSVIPVIDRKTADSVVIGGSGNTDVTGGMQGKIAELLDLADRGVESHIFHVSRIGDFLDGAEHGGTIVRQEPVL